jgi:hypothetical protein
MSTIDKETARARDLHRRHGEALSRDPALAALLRDYGRAIAETRETMVRLGIAEACAACAQGSAGSCCSEQVEDWYDHLLLLINLLMGVEIPRHREVPGHCLFVGPDGCKLMARHSFGINYLCPELKARLGAAGTREFLAVAGRELFSGWELERALRTWLHGNGTKQRDDRLLS